MAGKGNLSEPVRPHWFYCPPAGEKSPWLPLSYEDSHKLEEAYGEQTTRSRAVMAVSWKCVVWVTVIGVVWCGVLCCVVLCV